MANRFRRWRRGPRYPKLHGHLRAREWQIARAYAAYLMAAWPLLQGLKKAELRQVQVFIMARAMEHATYVDGGNRYYSPRRGFLKKTGELTKPAQDRAKYFLDMPRMQRAVNEVLDAKGFSLERCAEIMNEIATDKEADASARLRAIDMRIRLTIGYAPTKSGVLHAHTTVDGFFDENDFKNPPPITIEGNAQ